jgi:hypothetical protein
MSAKAKEKEEEEKRLWRRWSILEGLSGETARAAHVALRPGAVDEVLLRQLHQPARLQSLLSCSQHTNTVSSGLRDRDRKKVTLYGAGGRKGPTGATGQLVLDSGHDSLAAPVHGGRQGVVPLVRGDKGRRLLGGGGRQESHLPGGKLCEGEVRKLIHCQLKGEAVVGLNVGYVLQEYCVA